MSFCDEHGTADYCGECVYGPEIERLTAERDAAQAEARELRAELARVRELPAKWRAAPQNPDEPLLAIAADELDAALSQAAEQHDPLASKRRGRMRVCCGGVTSGWRRRCGRWPMIWTTQGSSSRKPAPRWNRRLTVDELIERLRSEAEISDRPGQRDRLNALADEFAAAFEAVREDAERWRALRELDGGEIYALLGDCDGIHPEQSDAAIDQARGKGVQS